MPISLSIFILFISVPQGEYSGAHGWTSNVPRTIRHAEPSTEATAPNRRSFAPAAAPGDGLRVHGRNPIVPRTIRHAEPSTGVTAPNRRSFAPAAVPGDGLRVPVSGGGLVRLRAWTPYPRLRAAEARAPLWCTTAFFRNTIKR